MCVCVCVYREQRASGVLSLSLPGSYHRPADPAWTDQNCGRWDNTKDLGRNQRQGSRGVDRQSWGELSKTNTLFLRWYSSICIQNFRNKQKWNLFLSNFLEQNRELMYVHPLCWGSEVVKYVSQKEQWLRLYSGSSCLSERIQKMKWRWGKEEYWGAASPCLAMSSVLTSWKQLKAEKLPACWNHRVDNYRVKKLYENLK